RRILGCHLPHHVAQVSLGTRLQHLGVCGGCLVGDQGSGGEVEFASGRQYVNHRSRHQERSCALGGEGVGDEVLPVNHNDRTSADDFKLGSIIMNHGRGV